jgi:predicted alpha-1,2-mannosidase
MGCYVHGNDPSHQVAYMYNWAGKQWKTAERVHQILNTKYLNKTDGLCGNDDCGQMSAWYIFSSMGFYPVCPGSNEYIIGSPSVSKAELRMGDKKLFVKTENLSAKNIYIQSMSLNGKRWSKSYFTHEDIKDGGTIVFKMGYRPSAWGTKADSRPN